MNEDKQIHQSMVKTILPYLIIGVLIVIASFFMKSCHDKPYINAKSDNTVLNDFIRRKGVLIQTIMSNNKTLRDSLFKANKAKIKIVYRTKTVYDSLLVVDTICVQALNTLHYEHSKIDSINNHIITNQETHIINDSHIIGNLTDIIAIQKYVITSDSLTIDDLTMTVKKEKRKGKLKTILWTALGVLGGGLIGGLR